MYTPISNAGISALMRWPVATMSITSIIGTVTNSVPGMIAAWGASVALCTYAVMEYYKNENEVHDCDCDDVLSRDGWQKIPVISWIIEYDEETGSKRPYELHSIRNDDMSTKEYYASYASEEQAMKKKSFFEQAMGLESSEEE
jgi:hypothetical protein